MMFSTIPTTTIAMQEKNRPKRILNLTSSLIGSHFIFDAKGRITLSYKKIHAIIVKTTSFMLFILQLCIVKLCRFYCWFFLASVGLICNFVIGFLCT